MATSQQGKKKSTAKSGTAKKKTTASKSNGKKTTAAQKQQQQSQKQIWAIALFALALIWFCLAFIPGASVWATIRGFLFGVLGFSNYIMPFILAYVAVMTSLNREFSTVRVQVVEACLFVLLLCSAIFIGFHNGDIINTYTEDIVEAYQTDAVSRSGGVFGAVIGGALLALTGTKAPAMIIIVVLILALLMIMSGTTLTSLAENMAKPVKKASEDTKEHFEERARMNEERQAMRAQQRAQARNNQAKAGNTAGWNPDVDLGPEYSTGAEVEEKPKRGRKKAAAAAGMAAATAAGAATAASAAAATPKEEPAPPIQIDDLVKKATKKQPEINEEDVAKAEKELEQASVVAEEDTSGYRLPPIDCLKPPKISLGGDSSAELKNNAEKLVEVLRSFGVETKIVDIACGPSVTRYELQPAVGVKISKITGLADDIALNLAATGIRIEAPIPGKAAVGIEVPNKSRDSVTLREIIDSTIYKKGTQKSLLNVALGKDISGNTCVTDLAKMPHLLIAGTTGSGKSVCLNAMILSILYNAKPDEVKLVMIDPKKVEFSVYNGIPHLLVPVVSEPSKAAGSLAWAVKEMLKRYKTFSENNVRDIKGYNELAAMDEEKPKMPHIVIFIDELADLMMATPKEVEDSICRLAQMARAAGMHLVIATQRPSVDVITGLIKANIPSRLSLSVSSAVDSRTILDMAGAEKLLGNGDMLFNPIGNSKPTRIQGCFTSDSEVEDVVNYIKKQSAAKYSEEVISEIESAAQAAEAANNKGSGGGIDAPSGGSDDGDVLLKDAIQVVIEAGQASTTLIQRKLKVGYARAARIVDELEERGVVGPFEGSKPRKVLMTKNQWLEMTAMSGDEDDGTAAAIDMGIDEE